MEAEFRTLRRCGVWGVAALCIATSAGCGAGMGGEQKLGGLERFRAHVMEERLLVSFVATELQWDQGLTFPIPGLPPEGEATLSFAPDLQSQGTVFQFSIRLTELARYTQAYPESGLPDGRALPDIRGGTLPRYDVSLRDRKVSIYLSKDVFGFFFPLRLSLPSGLPLPAPIRLALNDERGNRWGYSYAIGNPGPGILVLVPFTNPQSRTGVSKS